MTLQLSETWIGLLAALVPFLTALATKADTSNKVRAALAIVASAALTVVDSLVTGETSVSNLAGTFAAAMVISLATYHGLGKHLNINKSLAPNVGL